MAEDDLRQIVRITGKDLPGEKSIENALSNIKGIGERAAHAITQKAEEELEIDAEEKIGELSEEQSEKLEKIVQDPAEHDVPSWVLNRRKDYETGKHKHLTESDLDITIKKDIEREKKIRSYKGIRHKRGLRVRGQRTRTTGRSEETVGVKKTERMKKAQRS